MARQTKDFEELAEQLRLPGEIVERFGKLYAGDPDAAQDLLRKLQAAIGDAPAQQNGRSRRSGPTNVDIVFSYFESVGNRWQTKEQIKAATGLSDGAIHTVLYTTGKSLFESVRNLNGGKAAGFRLAASDYRPEGDDNDVNDKE